MGSGSRLDGIEAWTLDPLYIVRRNRPMLDARKMIANKLGVDLKMIKFDKEARKLVHGDNVVAKQSLQTWRVTFLYE